MSNPQSILLGRPIPFGAESYLRNRENDGATEFNFNNISDLRLGDEETFTVARGNDELTYKGDSHLMTIAPTGAGKGRSVIIPNLLNYDGPVIVVDPKGENYNVTSRYRREVLKQRIVKLDPFGQTAGDSDTFNPFDILKLVDTDANNEARMLANLIMIDKGLSKEPFWDNWAGTLLSGLAVYLATHKNVKDRSFVGMRDMLFGDDVKYGLAKLLDTEGKRMDREAYQDISTVMGISADNTFSGVLSSAQQYLGLFGAPAIRETLSKTSFSLRGIFSGAPMTVYIIIPPSKLITHQAILRLWVGALLTLISYRKFRPEKSSLFIIDEAAQLGKLDILQTAKTLLRGYGLQTWSFWQDFSQIQTLYATAWKTIVNNCAVMQVFGARNHMAASDFSAATGISLRDIREVDPKEQILIINGVESLRAHLFDYLSDPLFTGDFDANPLHEKRMKEEDFADLEDPAAEEEEKPESIAPEEMETVADESTTKKTKRSPFGLPPIRPASPPPPPPASPKLPAGFPPLPPPPPRPAPSKSPFDDDDDDDNPFDKKPSSSPFSAPRFNPFAPKSFGPPKNPASKITAFTVGTIVLYRIDDPKTHIPLALTLAGFSSEPQPLAISTMGQQPGAVSPNMKPTVTAHTPSFQFPTAEFRYSEQAVSIVYLESTQGGKDEDEPVYAYLKVTMGQMGELVRSGAKGVQFDLSAPAIGTLLHYGTGTASSELKAEMRKKYHFGGADVGYTTVRLLPQMEDFL